MQMTLRKRNFGLRNDMHPYLFLMSNWMVVQYCQTYTNREDDKILTYDLYSSYGS